jgi:hypothetical protein
MASISFIKPALPVIDPTKQRAPAPEAQELQCSTTIQMQGALTIAVEAPADDQLLFKLVSPADRQQNMLKLVWVQASIRALMPTINQMVEQGLIQSGLFPIARVVNPAFATDAQDRLLYLFQVPVSTFPPEQSQVQAPQQRPAAPGPIEPLTTAENPAMSQADIDALIGMPNGRA